MVGSQDFSCAEPLPVRVWLQVWLPPSLISCVLVYDLKLKYILSSNAFLGKMYWEGTVNLGLGFDGI